VVAGRDFLADRYLQSLDRELAGLGSPAEVDTIFIGGGTPTHLQPGQLVQLLNSIKTWLRLPSGNEFSVEANPAGLDEDRVRILAQTGVTRVSLGAQSFHDDTLKLLERDHGSQAITRAVETVRRHISQVSVDLIFGVPGQTLEHWKSDLRQALALAPDHVSTYGLTYEKGTPLWKQRVRGQINPIDEETEAAMYGAALDILGEAGFEQYEISNHARPGCRCRHNEVYWANEAYFGFGLGAARYIEGRREVNTRDLNKYMELTLKGLPATQQSEELPPRQRALETAAVQLRRAQGIDRYHFRDQTGFSLDEIAGPAIARHTELELLHDDGRRVCLTRAGKFVADSIIEALMTAVRATGEITSGGGAGLNVRVAPDPGSS
jgi:oxygen-independent coproporphyrinogen-3 oxidase